MKHILVLLVVFVFLGSVPAIAQRASKGPKWLSNKGFWIMESNRTAPKNATLYFYNNDKTLIYKEVVVDKRIRIEKRKVRKQLEAVLEQAITAWENEKVVKENRWVASRL